MPIARYLLAAGLAVIAAAMLAGAPVRGESKDSPYAPPNDPRDVRRNASRDVSARTPRPTPPRTTRSTFRQNNSPDASQSSSRDVGRNNPSSVPRNGSRDVRRAPSVRTGELDGLIAGTADTPSFVPPAPLPKIGGRAATISVTYNGFSAQARAAFQAAVDIWAAQLTSSVPITITAHWTPLATDLLGAAGPNDYLRSFTGGLASTWYPVALANKLAGTDLVPSDTDITCSFNSDQSRWYYGTDGRTPSGQYDLMTVVLHELGHGLGFVGSMTVRSGLGSWGSGTSFPFVYDRFAENGAGQSLINTSLFATPSAALAAELTGNSLYFDGTAARAGNGGSAARLYAPRGWESGSSYSHVDEATYGVGNANSLMTPVLNSAEAIHDPGPIMRGMFQDMGWTAVSASPPPAPTCTYAISPTSQSFSASGGSGSVTVTTLSGCSWTATSAATWVTISAGASGSGSGTVGYTVSANATTSARTATLTIAGHPFTVTEAAATATTTLASTRGNLQLNADTNADVFTYSVTTGAWSIERGSGSGSFSPLTGTWSPGWRVLAAEFNGDALGDFFLYNVSTGQWFKAVNAGNGAFRYFASTWSPAWTPYVLDFNGDGRSDVFLYNATTGLWFTCVSAGDGTGEFTYTAGTWSPGWQIAPADLDGNGRGDLFLYSRSTGTWYRVTTSATGTFSYYSETWQPNWDVTIGDYDGDGRSDVFLYAPNTGLYVLASNAGTTFAYSSGTDLAGAIARAGFFDGDARADILLYNAGTGQWRMLTDLGSASGTWTPGWQVHVTDLNADGRSDVLLYQPTTGVWFQGITTGLGTFSFSNGTWATGLTVVAGQTRLP